MKDNHLLVGYDFSHKNSPQKSSVFFTKPTLLYTYRYKFWVWLNFVFDVLRPWYISYKKLIKNDYFTQADIFHIHCPQWGYFDWGMLWNILENKKVIMTIHDDWLTSWNDKNNLYFPYKTRRSFIKRMQVFANNNIHFVGVSERISNKTKAVCNIENVTTIYNGVDTSIFYKRDKHLLRKKYNIPDDSIVVLGLAGSGSKTNLKWLWYFDLLYERYATIDNMLFVTVGNPSQRNKSKNYWEYSYLSSEEMAEYFSMADVFLYPTLADNCPLIVLESLACQCPVVSFDVGGISEILQHKTNGYIAAYKDIDDLATGLAWIIKHKDTFTIALDKKFTLEHMIENYKALYQSIRRKA